jgi:hypothetical protein
MADGFEGVENCFTPLTLLLLGDRFGFVVWGRSFPLPALKSDFDFRFEDLRLGGEEEEEEFARALSRETSSSCWERAERLTEFWWFTIEWGGCDSVGVEVVVAGVFGGTVLFFVI